MPLVREILSRVDIFMPNAIEAQRITQTDSLDEAVEILSAMVPLLVVKQGDKGAIACRENSAYQSPAIPSTVIDTTGAGDVFNAGFLAAYLQGKDTEECLQWGNFCGGMSVVGLGGLTTAPTAEQLQAWLQHQ
jgi:sugar/nucleoside kinase (ribokinase family)